MSSVLCTCGTHSATTGVATHDGLYLWYALYTGAMGTMGSTMLCTECIHLSMHDHPYHVVLRMQYCMSASMDATILPAMLCTACMPCTTRPTGLP